MELESLRSQLNENVNSLESVEARIIQQVSDKSEIFFSWISTIHAIQNNMSDIFQSALDIGSQIERLTKDLLNAENSFIKSYQQISNIEKTITTLENIELIIRSQPNIQFFLDAGSFDEASKLLSFLSSLFDKNDELLKIDILRDLVRDICDMKIALDKMSQMNDISRINEDKDVL